MRFGAIPSRSHWTRIARRAWRRPAGPVSVGVVVVLVLTAWQLRPSSQVDAGLVIQGGTLIDVRRGSVVADQTIVVKGDRIERVGPAAQVQAPAGAKVIDARGKFVMPGLWDSHAHTRDFDGVLNINHGVTSTMDMGNILDWILALQEAREKQMSFGPRIFPQGMSIGGRLGQHQWNVKGSEDARLAARRNIEAGVNFLKVYQNATLEMIKAVGDEARKAGLNLNSHLRTVDAREAILAGVTGLAHSGGVAAATSPPAVAEAIKSGKGGEDLGNVSVSAHHGQDPAMFASLIKLMLERNVYLEPNIVQLFRGVFPEWDRFQLEYHRISMIPELHYIPEMFVRMWATDFPYEPYPPKGEQLEKLKKAYSNHLAFAKQYADAGGKLMLGTDNYYHAVAGLAAWQEMELMASGGIAPAKILQAATINPAEFVHKDKELATIESGKLADIIILGQNPLQDVRNIRSLEKVVQHGKEQELGYHADYRVMIPRPWQRVNSTLPAPYLSSVAPAGVPIGTKNLVLTIKGRDFNRENRVLWGTTELRVSKFSPTELTVAVPEDLVRAPGTYKVHMITGGRVHQPSLNFQEVLVTFGRTFPQRWNGQSMSTEF
jgi:imidazolonepropionase-like amidohydrolase